MNSVAFPSISEVHNSELQCENSHLLEGLKVYDNNVGYIVGELALKEGISPHKIMMSSPDDSEYQILAKSALVLLGQKIQNPINLTVGLPYSTFKVHRKKAEDFLKRKHDISYDIFSFNGNYRKNVSVDVEKVDIIPEIIGSSLIARHDFEDFSDAFVAGIGYGTFEACLTNEQGIVERTIISTRGLKYAIDIAMKELSKSHSLNLRTDHQFDQSFLKGKIILDRKKMDLKDIRSIALNQYFNEVLVPAMKNSWNDSDFENATSLYLAGGGAMYSELVDLFRREFEDVLKIEIINEPMTAVSRGYCLRSLKLGDANFKAVGLDIGNSMTVLSYIPIEEDSNK